MNAADASPQEIAMWDALCHLTDRVWRRMSIALRFHGKGTLPNFPIPVRLPFGAWWLAWNDVLGKAVLKGTFERAECDFLWRLLRPGMTVLDNGAHHAYYTLLASCRVGNSGRVFAVEPSPRERQKLRRHLRWNHYSNVEVVDRALGARASQAELFLAGAGNRVQQPAPAGSSRHTEEDERNHRHAGRIFISQRD